MRNLEPNNHVVNKQFFVSLTVVIVAVTAFSINYAVKRGKQELSLPTPSVTVSSDYYDDKLFCEKDSDCTVQETLTSSCCGNACPHVVNVYHAEQTIINCSNAVCTDLYFICPKFEVKCIDSQCKRIDLNH